MAIQPRDDGLGSSTTERILDYDDERLAPETDFFGPNNEAVLRDLYEPLEAWQTRVLSLLPGVYGEALSGTLHVVDLLYDPGVLIHGTKTRIFYDALSYCWGDSTLCRLLMCNGAAFSITKEAYRALQRLRSPDRPVHVWVDAICINQTDNDEKSRQVRKMISIYKKAELVYVWLGERVGASRLAAKRLADFGRPQGCIEPVEMTTDTLSSLEAASEIDWTKLSQEHSKVLFDGLQDLLSSPWFSRVWVMQEIWAARNAVVVCGDIRFRWKCLLELSSGGVETLLPWHATSDDHIRALIADHMKRAATKLLSGDQVAFATAETREIPNRRLRDTPDHMLDLVNVFRRSAGSSCTVLHDHVYGLLGMTAAPVCVQTEPITRNAITLDYNKSISQVFQEATRYIIRRDRCLTILYIDHLSMRRGVMGDYAGLQLPSWVPDLRWPLGETSALYEKDGTYVRYFASTCYSDITRGNEKDGILRIQGVQVGSIQCLAQPAEIVGYPAILERSRHSHHPAILRPSRHASDQIPWQVAAVCSTFDALKLESDRLIDAWRTFCSTTQYTWHWHVPPLARTGDIVVVAEGGGHPLVLRPSEDGVTYALIGPAIVPEGGDIRLGENGPFVSFAVYMSDLLEDRMRSGRLVAFDLR